MDAHEPCPDSEATQPAKDLTQSAGPRPDPPTVSSPGNTALDRLAGSLAQAAEKHPSRIGSFQIVGILGKGGMGVVYEARQDRPTRNVALKVVRPGLASAEALRRFELEAQVLARLQHPGIAQVYEVGTADIGAGPQPYFAMELVRGVNLREYADSRKLGVKERLELMGKVCDAVQHAHQKGIIHRDLKPGNILVDESGQPKILDFGVARVTDSDVKLTTIQTDVGQLIGTIPYMSPEQVSADPNDLDTRSDVYALGVILYELLAGRLPYDVHKRLIHEAARVIREDDPTPLSSINRTLRGDVETIVAKAMEKDKTRRYQAASALAADIRRYLGNEPIAARPASAMYQLSKFARRNRALVGGVVAVFAVLLAGIITSTGLYLRAETALAAESVQRKLVQEREEETVQISEFQEEQLAGIDAQTMGLRLRQDLLNKVREAAEASRRPKNEIDARVAEIENLTTGVDFTSLALETLDENVFQRALSAVEKKFGKQPRVKARLLHTMADTLRELGLLEAAVRPQEEALAIFRRDLGNEDPNTLASVSNMAVLLNAQGKMTEAGPYYHESLETKRRVLGEDHPDTISSVNNLGVFVHSQGKSAEAEQYFRLALEKRRRVLGPDHPQTLVSLGNLGDSLRAQGKLDEAESAYREALEKQHRVLSEGHPETLGTINNLGALLYMRGKMAEAEPLFRDALEKRRRVLGDDHPNTLTSLTNLAVLLQTQGKLAEAEPLFRDALEKKRRILGGGHPDTIASIHNLGVMLQYQDNLVEAEPLLHEALQMRRNMLGDEHPGTLNSINSMGSLFEAQGRLSDAEELFREAMEKRRRLLGGEHPSTIDSICRLGFVLQSEGRLPEAERLLREAVEKSQRALGDEHPDTLIAVGYLGNLLVARGDSQEAIALLSPAEPPARKAFIAANAIRLGRLLTTLGRARVAGAAFKQAEANLSEAHEILEAAKGSKYWDRAGVYAGMLELYDAWHTAEPGKGYDRKAAHWREKLETWRATTQPASSQAATTRSAPSQDRKLEPTLITTGT